MADIKAIKGTDNTTYSIVDRFSQWGGNNLLKNIYKSHNSSSYLAYQFNMTENLKAGETYTIQLGDVDIYHSAKTAAQTGVSFYGGGGSVNLFGWTGPTYFTAETNNYHADYLTKTFTVTAAQASGSGSANAGFNVYNSPGSADGTRSMSIGKGKLEKGHKATDGSPCGADIFTYNNEQIDVNI